MARHTVGIDLGTTHTVVASVDRQAANAAIELFHVEQLVAPGEVAPRPLLPSLRYHPAEGELAADALQLPWHADDPGGVAAVAVGALARRLGAQVPGRLVASAKSWLSHAAVDRTAAILPWGAAEGVPRVSPVAASASYLAHVRAAWDARHPGQPLARQEVVLTVPASFDEAARELTLEAARHAGLPRLRLLEEPQAALYDWLHRHAATLAGDLAATRLVLVCDVGGGTTDLSLIRVEPPAADETLPRLTRIGVGNHLMLGGDNMDLALAHRVESQWADGGGRLSAARLSQLIERCRSAKEQLLAADAPDSVPVTLLGGGSRLIGGTRTVDIARADVEALIVDGFFPHVAATNAPQRARGAIVEFGLPYASDAAVTRHLAGFLQRHAAASREALGAAADDAPDGDAVPISGPVPVPIPDTLLLNGGVFRAPALAGRLQAVLAGWRGAPLQLLHNDNPDVAVARGAVAFALAQHGGAAQIGGGSARSYVLQLARGKRRPNDPAAARRGVCVLARGAEPGAPVRLAQQFALRLGQPVRFHLLSSTADAADAAPLQAGDLVELDAPAASPQAVDWTPLPPIATVLSDTAGARGEVAVQLEAELTEVGTLELHCVTREGPERRWRLQFQLREADGEDGAEDDAADASAPAARPASRAERPGLAEALDRIDAIFGSRTRSVDPKEVRQLRARLEACVGARERWDTALARALHDALMQRAKGRRRTPEHERAWLNLAGWCLRPGFGDALDSWRMGQLWPLFEQGVQHGGDGQVAAEWWTLWRRVAGGLDEAAQLRVLDDFAWNVQGRVAGVERPPRLVKATPVDLVRLVAALERLPAAPHKVEIGDWLLESARKAIAKAARAGNKPDDLTARQLWALGRLGARVPFYASAHHVVDAAQAHVWLDALTALDWKRVDGAAFAAAQLARKTGDRARDIDDAHRDAVLARLTAVRAAPAWSAMVREAAVLDEAVERQVYGESLPPGLRLIG